MPTVNDCKRLLDVGWEIALWRGDDDLYGAMVSKLAGVDTTPLTSNHIAAADTPEQALCRLAEKMAGNIVGEK